MTVRRTISVPVELDNALWDAARRLGRSYSNTVCWFVANQEALAPQQEVAETVEAEVGQVALQEIGLAPDPAAPKLRAGRPPLQLRPGRRDRCPHLIPPGRYCGVCDRR